MRASYSAILTTTSINATKTWPDFFSILINIQIKFNLKECTKRMENKYWTDTIINISDSKLEVNFMNQHEIATGSLITMKYCTVFSKTPQLWNGQGTERSVHWAAPLWLLPIQLGLIDIFWHIFAHRRRTVNQPDSGGEVPEESLLADSSPMPSSSSPHPSI